jgi:hypothetical protein
VKYLLLIYNNPDALAAMSEAETQAVYARVDTLLAELRASGELVGGDGLAPPATGKIVRVRNGVVATTDGPFAEAKEQFAGYVSVDVAGEERAIEIAASWPGADRWAMEVRAVLGSADDAG